MKILHLSQTFAPIGGVETYLLDLIPLLAQRGHQNVVIYREKHPRMAAQHGLPLYHVPHEQAVAAAQAEITDIVRREKPNLIYLHMVNEPAIIKRVAELAPTVSYIHIFYPVCPGLAKYFRRGDKICTRPFGLGCLPMIYWRRCASARHPLSVYGIMRDTRQHLVAYHSLRRTIVASRYMKELLIQNNFQPNHVEVLPYFIPIPERSALTPPEREKPSILFAGRLEMEKGLPYLLQAVARLQTKCQLFVAGDGTLKEEYMRLADELGIAERVKFLSWLSKEQLQAYYRRATLTVMPTIMPEPFGKVGVEAMANCRAVVAFDVGGIPDWLKDGYNGYLVPSRDIEMLRAKIELLLTHPDLCQQLGNQGRQYVEEYYSSEEHLEKLLRIFTASAG
jgi:glycosyltransferase involved in cell wall biosynthesis